MVFDQMSDPKSKMDPGANAAQIQKPGLVNQLVPWVITAAIFIWLYRTIDFKQMFEIMLTARLGWFLPFIAGFSVLCGLVDAFTFGQTYSWFCAKLTTREKLELRIAPMTVQVVFAPLAEVMFPLYLWRRKGVSPAHAVSTSFWTMISDVAAQTTALTIGIIYNLKTGLVPQINTWWLVAVCVFWAVYFGNIIFWHTPAQPKIAAWVERSRTAGADQSGAKSILLKAAAQATQLLRTFSLARWYHYLYVYAVRLLIVTGALACNYATLKSLNITVPTPLAIVALPIIFYSYFLPINVGGFGGPQALAILFLYEIGHCGSKEQIAAFSFLFSTGFLIGRFLFGAVFIRSFWRHTFPEGFSRWRKGTET
jgi:hypothetical protein